MEMKCKKGLERHQKDSEEGCGGQGSRQPEEKVAHTRKLVRTHTHPHARTHTQ